MNVLSDRCLLPSIDDGRFFVSPVLGCTGACSYCYLEVKNFNIPRKNELSEKELLAIAKGSEDFAFGREGTIISVGAWGDIFPLNNLKLVSHSIQIIKALMSWGNPVQIMSKNFLNCNFVEEIVREVKYPGQLLYSTTLTTLAEWEKIEAGTSSPIERLETCLAFHNAGVPTNVLLKPFIPNLTDLEIEKIAELLLKYHIDYCTVGIMYWSPKIAERVLKNPFLRNQIDLEWFAEENHLDCNGEKPMLATPVDSLIPHVNYLREKGIAAFLKSSCVNSNVLKIVNISGYFRQGNLYCVQCGNCLGNK